MSMKNYEKPMLEEQLKSLCNLLKPSAKRVGFDKEKGLLIGLTYYSNGAWALRAEYAPSYVVKAKRRLVREEDSKKERLDMFFNWDWRGLLKFEIFNKLHVFSLDVPIVVLATPGGGNETWVNGYYLTMMLGVLPSLQDVEIRSLGKTNPVYVIDKKLDRMAGVIMPVRGLY